MGLPPQAGHREKNKGKIAKKKEEIYKEVLDKNPGAALSTWGAEKSNG